MIRRISTGSASEPLTAVVDAKAIGGVVDVTSALIAWQAAVVPHGTRPVSGDYKTASRTVLDTADGGKVRVFISVGSGSSSGIILTAGVTYKLWVRINNSPQFIEVEADGEIVAY